jgi:hypothetical protein
MQSRSGNIVRETGTALAVLAIYILTLLTPLHQAAGLQRDLARLGFQTISWSICTPLAQEQDGKAPVVVKCPAAGIAKNEFVAIEPATVDIGVVRHAEVVRYTHIAELDPVSVQRHAGQPRAPPVTV